MAAVSDARVRDLVARDIALIRVDAVWLAVEPLDMRAGTESALARVVKVFGSARPHTAYLRNSLAHEQTIQSDEDS